MDRLLTDEKIRMALKPIYLGDVPKRNTTARIHTVTSWAFQISDAIAKAQIRQDNEWIKSHKWARRSETGEIYYMIPESELKEI